MITDDKKAIDRFWSRVQKTEKCWNWNSKSSHGYGSFPYFKNGVLKNYRAHRVSWMISNGDIPQGKVICHKCDNPSCVRPDHLFLGTQRENILDMVSKGRGGWNPNNKLNHELANEIRRLRNEKTFSYKELAEKFGVSKKLIIMVVKNRIWVEVEKHEL